MSCIYIIESPEGGYIGLDSSDDYTTRLSHHLAGSFHITKWNGNSGIKFYGSEKMLNKTKIAECNFWVNEQSGKGCYGLGDDVWEAFKAAGWKCDSEIKGKLDFAETVYIVANRDNILGGGTKFASANKALSDTLGSDFYYDARQDAATKELIDRLNRYTATGLDVIRNGWKVGEIRLHFPSTPENIIKLSNPAEYAFYDVLFIYIRDYIMSNEALYYHFMTRAVSQIIVNKDGKIQARGLRQLIEEIYKPKIERIVDIARQALMVNRQNQLNINGAKLDLFLENILKVINAKGLARLKQAVHKKAIKEHLKSKDFTSAIVSTIFGVRNTQRLDRQQMEDIKNQIERQMKYYDDSDKLSHVEITDGIKDTFSLDLTKTNETSFKTFSKLNRTAFDNLNSGLYDKDPNKIPYWLKLAKQRGMIATPSSHGFRNVNYKMKYVYADIFRYLVDEVAFTMNTPEPPVWLSNKLQDKYKENREYNFNEHDWYELYHRMMSIVAGGQSQYQVKIKDDDVEIDDGNEIRHRKGSEFIFQLWGQNFSRQKYRIIPLEFEQVPWNYNWSQSLFEQYETWTGKTPADIDWSYLI